MPEKARDVSGPGNPRRLKHHGGRSGAATDHQHSGGAAGSDPTESGRANLREDEERPGAAWPTARLRSASEHDPGGRGGDGDDGGDRRGDVRRTLQVDQEEHPHAVCQRRRRGACSSAPQGGITSRASWGGRAAVTAEEFLTLRGEGGLS